jgi:hypothetical protein
MSVIVSTATNNTLVKKILSQLFSMTSSEGNLQGGDNDKTEDYSIGSPKVR